MRLVHKFTLKPNNETAIILGTLTYASARLFNAGNYERIEYKKLGFEKAPDWYDQKRRLKDNMWFKSLPSQTAQDVLKRVDEAWVSYYSLLKTKGIKNPQPPFYKSKNSHFNIRYLNNSFLLINDKIRLMIPKELKSYLKEKYNITANFFYIDNQKELKNIKLIEFKYLSDETYDVYIIYEKEEKTYIPNERYISIDLGLVNLATIYDNIGKTYIISGTAYLNTKYYFSKRIGHLQSILHKQNGDSKKTSKQINNLYQKENNKIDYIVHKTTKMILDYCLENDVRNVIVGDITGIRKDNDMGHINNQKFHALPFRMIYQKLAYKLKLNGIKLYYQQEAYTSSCLIDSIDVSKEYQTKSRIKRGLCYDKEKNTIYNADCVGAFNIMRLFKKNNNLSFEMNVKGLSSPEKHVSV